MPGPKALRRKGPPPGWRWIRDEAPALGFSNVQIRRAVNLGVIRSERFLTGTHWTIWVPGGKDRHSLWPEFLARNLRPTSMEGFAKVDRAACLLGVPGDFVWPEEFCDAAIRLLKRSGLPLVYKEFKALVRGRPEVVSELLEAALERQGLPTRLFRRRRRPDANVAEFRAALADIDGLPGTVLAQPDEAIDKLLGPKERGAIVALPSGKVRNMVGLYAAVKCFGMNKVSARHRAGMTHDGEVLTEALAGVDPDDEVAMERAVRAYVLGAAIEATDSRNTRARTGSSYVTFSNLWKSHAEDYPETRRALKRAMPAFPPGIALFALDLKSLKKNLGRATRKRRKARTDPIADERDVTEALLEARAAQVERWTAEYLKAKAIVEADPALERWSHPFIDDVVPEDGLPDGSRQVVFCTAVRADALRRELHGTAKGSERAKLATFMPGGANHDVSDHELILCVFDAVRVAQGSGGPAMAPAFVRLHASGCLANPAGMRPEKQAERAALIKRWGLPTWSPPPAGLITPAWGRETLIAAQALRQERVVLHLEDFRHSTRVGRVAGRLGLRCGMRSGETRQTRWQLSGFGFARTGGQICIGVRAFPKKWSRQRLFVDDVTFLAMADLVELNVERLFPGAASFQLPQVPIPALKAPIGPLGHAVFQNRAGLLKATVVNRCYRLLMAGSPPGVLHDLRHVFANAAAMAGVELDDIADLLSQEGRSLAAYYAAATERQVAAALARLNAGADDRLAIMN